MDTVINAAIEILANRIDNSTRSEDALRNSQAALNLAHVLQVIAQTDYSRSQMPKA